MRTLLQVQSTQTTTSATTTPVAVNKIRSSQTVILNMLLQFHMNLILKRLCYGNKNFNSIMRKIILCIKTYVGG